MTAGRAYLSIGDVLTLLRQEFPDVTISKIRFLESQGLVNPERTPSGYRKFYDPDVERLRWVLRQQREHFLPLKVIKGRLDDVSVDTGEDSEAHVGGDAPDNGGNGSVLVEVAAASEGLAGGVALATVGAAQARRPETTARGSYSGEASGQLPGFDPAFGRDRLVGSADSRPGAAGDSGGPVRRSVTPATAGRAASGSGVGGRQSAARPVSRRVPEADQTGPRALAREEDGVPEVPGAGASGRLTAAELAQASGLSEPEVDELGSYGILGGRSVGGVVYYDESDVAIAELAAGFARFGIEPRHLRMYKHASDRESGFVEQLVLPLLKQRNPDARKRATEMASELTRLGQGLRAALIRRGLQDLLGG
jgi:DNA-binding transcriptional MerR regulator